MTVYYRDIQPLQEPADVGVDEDGRAQFSVNFLVTKRPSGTLIPELIRILVAAGVGQDNVNIFGSSKATIPDGKGPFLTIRPTGGTAPLGTHDGGVGAYRRPSVQILTRASTSAAAEAMAHAAYTALMAVRNLEVA